MNFFKPTADFFIPDHKPIGPALARTTHLGVGAHQDDLEFMAFHGILSCYQQENKWFSGVTVGNGSGSSRTGPYAKYTDEEMMRLRREEQKKAAIIGDYSAMVQLDYGSAEIKRPHNPNLIQDFVSLIKAMRPDFVYTHNLADKHPTHVALTVALITALRQIPVELRPKKIFGCEGWRNLDWMPDKKKILNDVTGRDHLLNALMGVYDSQIAGGKRYDRATEGRKRANATYYQSHHSDQADLVEYAMDLTPLINDPDLDMVKYTTEFIRQFENEVRDEIQKYI
ncbi:MAG: PIG-L family deacetylase [Verrucomicrobiota bacterium]|nr:PIG-L family deacetylase [Verrucomicrobiota bacterium]